jgi:ATPase subunit of ABC transporter with duplicated ATPase domains
VSHDMRLISQVAKEIWICDNKTITPYKGDIASFKLDMRKQMGLEDGKQGSKALRGDFSVKVKEGEEIKKTKPEPPPKAKLEVVAPPTKASAPPVVTPVAPMAPPPQDVSVKKVADADETTVASTATNTSIKSTATTADSATVAKPAPSTTSLPAPAAAAAPATTTATSAPAKGKYIPPHLRKKMQEQQS